MYSQKGTSALMYASLDGHAGILEALLKRPDVDINQDNVCLTFVVHFMCERTTFAGPGLHCITVCMLQRS